ncbi:hypothetical protein V6N13_087322 [Hibiscus sabdariffa]
MLLPFQSWTGARFHRRGRWRRKTCWSWFRLLPSPVDFNLGTGIWWQRLKKIPWKLVYRQTKRDSNSKWREEDKRRLKDWKKCGAWSFVTSFCAHCRRETLKSQLRFLHRFKLSI